MESFLSTALITLAGVLIFSIGYSFFSRRKTKKYYEMLEANFGKVPHREFGLKFESISSLWAEKFNYDRNEVYIDEITWNDLDMDKVYARINNCHTSAGEEYLYSKLHEPESSEDELMKREAIIFTLDANPELRKQLQIILAKVGKLDYNGIADLCYNAASKRVNRPVRYTILAIIPFLFVALIFVNPVIGFTGLLLSLIANGIVHYFESLIIAPELVAIKYFSALLWGANQVGQLLKSEEIPLADDLLKSYTTFKKLGGKMSSFGQQKLSDFDSIIEYIHILLLSDIRHFDKVINAIEQNTEHFKNLFFGIGEIDLALCVLSYRKSMNYYSQPKFVSENQLVLKEIFHPLLEEPVSNTVTIPKYSLISGANASGKSTFIKSIALNAILAQTINTCSAKEFQMKFSQVMTSMAIRDDVTSGDSYFIAEIKSMKRIVDAISERNCLCIFDEILRGTNTVERIAASTAVLEYVAKKDCICIVATHDIELTNILDGLYQNYHFSEKITDEGVEFDYKIRDGATKSRNAITLLDFLGFDKEITVHANELASNITRT